MAIKNYAITGTAFAIMIDDTLTDLDRKVLTHLYLPIIGDKALCIYETLYTMIDSGLRESNVINHSLLLKMTNLKIKEFVEERIKLEALGLLDTYYKDNTYIYVLKNVLTPYEFFKDEALMEVLHEAIGEEALQNLAYDFLLRKLDTGKFENITASFDEVFEKVSDCDELNYSKVGVNTTNNGIKINNEKFNLEHFILLLDATNLVKEETLTNSSFLDKIVRYAFLYGLSVEELKDAVVRSVNTSKEVNEEELSINVKKQYEMRNDKASFIPKKEIVRSSNKLVNMLNKLSPNDVVKNKYRTELTSVEIQMFDKLLLETNISVGMLNVAILYVMSEKNGQIPSYNYFLKIINTWIRAGVKNTEEALDFINGKSSTYNTSPRPRKAKAVKEAPDWYKEQTQEQKKKVKTNKENEEELVDIASFFKS